MILTLFQTVCYFLWMIILAAVAVVAVTIACIIVKVVFFDSKKGQFSENSNEERI